MVVLKSLILGSFTLKGCGVLKGLILDHFYIGRMWKL